MINKLTKTKNESKNKDILLVGSNKGTFLYKATNLKKKNNFVKYIKYILIKISYTFISFL